MLVKLVCIECLPQLHVLRIRPQGDFFFVDVYTDLVVVEMER
jgi:hypothetical protein